MIFLRNLRLACALLVGLATVAWAAQQPAVEIRAVNNFTLHVTENTPLNVVLDELCSRAHATCEGTQLAAGIVVARMQVSGEWDTLLDSLLHGSKLDYVSVAGSGTNPRQLVITVPSATTSTSSTSLLGGLPAGTSNIVAGNPVTSNVGEIPSSPTSEVEAQTSPNIQTRSQNGDAGSPSIFGSFTEGAASSGNTPFPDSTGRSFPGENSGPAGLMFPDSTGRTPPPVPDNEGQPVMPFPDSTGRVPPHVTSSPGSLPFPDSTGARPPSPK